MKNTFISKEQNRNKKVLFCSVCVMSNQRPSSHPEHLKKNVNDIKYASFNKQNKSNNFICHACLYNKQKRKLNWSDRNSEFLEIVKKIKKNKKNNNKYDCVVPGSGGKDSQWVALKLREHGLNPLCVTWSPAIFTNVGKKNLKSWKKKFDHILFKPKKEVHQKITKEAFLNLGNPFQSFVMGMKSIGIRYAMNLGIKYVFYGENPAENHNDIKELQSSKQSLEYFTSETLENIFYGGIPRNEFIKKYKFKPSDLDCFTPVNRKLFLDSGVESHYMSHFFYWDSQRNYYEVRDKLGFNTNPDGRSEGTYTSQSSLDDKLDGQNYYLMYIKFGQGRAVSDACKDIRDGYITRDEAIEIIRKYDHEFPKKYFNDFLKYIGINKKLYFNTIDKFRAKNLWKFENNKWKLKHIVK